MVYQWNISGITSGIPVEYQWYTSGIAVVYQWNISGIQVEYRWYYQWYTSGISVVYQWKSVVKFGGITTLLSTDITTEIIVITTVLAITEIHHFTSGTYYHQILPLISTGIPLVIPLSWYTAGNSRGIF